jgi:hypothetical protein
MLTGFIAEPALEKLLHPGLSQLGLSDAAASTMAHSTAIAAAHFEAKRATQQAAHWPTDETAHSAALGATKRSALLPAEQSAI